MFASKSHSHAEPATQKRAQRKGALLFLALGAALISFHRTAQDYASAAFTAGGISIPQPTYLIPAGQVGTRGEVSHTFRIYNLRPQRLSVQAQPDCGCTGVSWKSATIAPFSWKDVTARMEVRKEEASGRSVSIAFRTDSRDKPYLFAFMQT